MTPAARRCADKAEEQAELRHRDASQRECRRVVAQGEPLQCAEGSPAASARAAAVISESIGISSHLSLPSFETRR